MAWSGTNCFIDEFNRAQAFTTTPGMNGWTIKDTSSSGTPTYLCITADEGAFKLTMDNTNEAQIVTLYQNNVLTYDIRHLSNIWWVAQVAGIAATDTLVMGVASAQNDTSDTVEVNAWFRMDGGTSTSTLYVETDDNTTNVTATTTGTTLAAAYKRLLIDFTQGLGDVRFFVDGARVAAGTTFDMSAVAAGQNVQPYIQLQKSGGTGVGSLTVAQFGATFKWSY